MDDSKKEDKEEISSARDLVKECFRNVEDAYCHKKSVYSIPTYSHGLDSLLMGLHKSDLILVVGRPGVGKSAFIHNIIVNTAMEKIRVLFFSPEMQKQMVIMRLLSIESGVPYYNIDCAKLGEIHWPKLTTAAGRLSDSVLNIDDTLPLHMSRIKEVANEMKSNNKLDLLVIDSLPFISADNNESKDETGIIAMALKCLARELNIPVIVTVPLKAETANYPKQHPCLADIKSDSIVSIADVIILLHKVMSSNKKKGKVDAIVAKNRNGAQGIVHFNYDNDFLGFQDKPSEDQTSLSMQCIDKYKEHLTELLRKKELQRQKQKSAIILAIEDRLRMEIGISDVNLADMDEGLAQVIADTLIMLSKSFQSSLSTIIYKTEFNGNRLAYVDQYGKRIVFLNKYYKNSPSKRSPYQVAVTAAHEYAHTIIFLDDKSQSASPSHNVFRKEIKDIHVRYLSQINDVRLKMCRILKKEDLQNERDRKNIYKRPLFRLYSIAKELKNKGSMKGEHEFVAILRYLSSFNINWDDPTLGKNIDEFFACAFARNYDSSVSKLSPFAIEVLEATKKYFGKDAQQTIWLMVN